MTSYTQRIKIAFLNVGQGDTIVISSPDTKEAIVVDCADAVPVLQYLEQEEIQHLRGIIITHMHVDHYAGILQLIDNYAVVPNLEWDSVLACNFIRGSHALIKSQSHDEDHHSESYEVSTSKSRQMKTIYRQLTEWGLANRRFFPPVMAGMPIPIGGDIANCIEVLHPFNVHLNGEIFGSNLNNLSVVLRVTGVGSNALLTGDIEAEGWEYLVEQFSDESCTVLKFPHHGAWKKSDVAEVLDSVDPKIVIISVGTDGEKYGHPNKKVFDALVQRPHIRLLCTQATSQCGAHISMREQIVAIFNNSSSNSNTLLGSNQGCPCAGTVIIELDERASILQPSTNFHQSKIIKQHFAYPQCVISTDTLEI